MYKVFIVVRLWSGLGYIKGYLSVPVCVPHYCSVQEAPVSLENGAHLLAKVWATAGPHLEPLTLKAQTTEHTHLG